MVSEKIEHHADGLRLVRFCKDDPVRMTRSESFDDLRRILFLCRRTDDKVLLHARMCGKEILQFIHLKFIVLTASRRIDENKVLAAVTCDRLSEIRGRVNDLHRKPQNLRVFL